jgi:hypothetical protein
MALGSPVRSRRGDGHHTFDHFAAAGITPWQLRVCPASCGEGHRHGAQTRHYKQNLQSSRQN